MYTHIKQVQIIISLLKQYNIRHFVISPGTRHVPLVHSVEIDPFFTCYSVVDERSAAFVALGLAKALHAPVCITCTSSTACCNYMPAMQEAFEKNIPIVALTSDRARYQRFHGENQCINQVDMFRPFCKYAVDVPLVLNDDDYWYCNRCVNEAFMAIKKGAWGPVQVNFLEPLRISELSTFNVTEIPTTRKINLLEGDIRWDKYASQLKNKKVLVVCGDDKVDNKMLREALLRFDEKFETVITTDHFANVTDEQFIHTPGLDNVLNFFEFMDLQPDIVISYGSKVYSGFGVQYRGKNIPHWYINKEGHLYDPMRTLENIFAVTPIDFFNKISDASTGINSKVYYKEWKQRMDTLHLSPRTFTNFYAIKETLLKLPPNSTIHASVLNAIRFTNFCQLPENTTYIGNLCADGIDGALSTFIGQAVSTSNLALLVIGDLSYLYDLNASIDSLPSNVRILLVNNNAGAEFHFNISLDRISTLNLHIAASHNNQFAEVANLGQLKYSKAENADELKQCLQDFFAPSNTAKLLEVVTNADNDGRELRAILESNRNPVSLKRRIMEKIKRLLN